MLPIPVPHYFSLALPSWTTDSPAEIYKPGHGVTSKGYARPPTRRETWGSNFRDGIAVDVFILFGKFFRSRPGYRCRDQSESSLLYHDDSAAASVPFIPVISNGTPGRHGLR